MNLNLKHACLPMFGIFLFAACSNEPTSNAPPSDPAQNDTETTREALEFVAPCLPSTCGEVPASSKASKPACVPSNDACEWSDPGGSVSFRQCEASECGAEPDASVCPAGTTKKGATCGSENDGACAWHTACAFPPSTTPCPTENGCGPQPMLGVVCDDGSNGELRCMKVGTKCEWQPSCQ